MTSLAEWAEAHRTHVAVTAPTMAGQPSAQISKSLICWRSLRDSNPCFSLERALAHSMATGF